MRGPSTISEQDLRRLLDVVTPDRAAVEDSPPEALPMPVLLGLAELIPCASISFFVMDARRREHSGLDVDLADLPEPSPDDLDLFFDGYWDCLGCCYPERSGDRETVLSWTDFYTDRAFRELAMGRYFAKNGLWHELLVSLPPVGGRERRLMLTREVGDAPFSERDRLLLTLMRPHLVELRNRVEAQRRTAVDRLTPRQRQLLARVAVGATNRQIARELGLSEGTVRKHLENIYARLGVGSRTEALARVRGGDALTGAGELPA